MEVAQEAALHHEPDRSSLDNDHGSTGEQNEQEELGCDATFMVDAPVGYEALWLTGA